MAKNFVQQGATIPFVAGANYSSGAVVVLGGLIGVVLSDVANGNTGLAAIEGVFQLPKVSTVVLTVGERVQWDVSQNSGAGAVNDSGAVAATGDIVNCGVAVAPAGNGDTTCLIKINVPGGTIT